MTIRINSKLAGSQQMLRYSSQNKEKMDKTLEKLSSGRRVNRAADDASALAMAEKMGSALKGLEQAQRNAFDGLSLAKVADGGMSQVNQYLGRMKDLAMAGSSGVLSDEQRSAINLEFTALKDEVDRLSESAEFNGTKLLDGSAGEVQISLGENGGGLSIDLATPTDSIALGLENSRVDGPDGSNALSALEDIDAAMAQVSARRADLGASSNRLVSANREMAIQTENTYASQSRLVDADMALEASNLARQQILTQSSNAMLAQGRGLSATALNLLK